MAAGRHGGYRDNEFRDRESSVNASRRELAYSKEEYERARGRDNRNAGRGRIHDVRDRDRARVRQKDIKEREAANGGYRSSSSRSDSGTSGGNGSDANRRSRQPVISVRAVDKEPGELSSESGSEEAIESESQVKDSKVSRTGAESGMQSPVEKKRKFSPIVWDRDDDGSLNSSKKRTLVRVTTLPPPPPLPKNKQVPSNNDGGVQVSSIRDEQGPQSPLPDSEGVPADLGDKTGSESPAGLSSMLASPIDKDRWGNSQDAEQLEDEDYVPTRNISSSRWASGDGSPVDEGEIIEDEEVPKRAKRGSLADSLGTKRRHRKSVTPELGEFKRDGSRGAGGRSSESDDRVSRVRSSSDDHYSGHDSDRNEYMDLDEDRENKVMGANLTDTESEGDDDSPGTPEPIGPPQRSVNMLQGCRSVDEFERLNKIDEGTYGVVYRARDKKTGEVVALKKVKMEKEREGFPLTSLREINILLSFHHPSIVDVKEVVVGSNLDSIFMVMEYMEHDLKGLMENMKQPFSQSEVKCLMLQLLEGVKYLHDNWVLHRDLKTSNLLMNNRGELKICDFGLARQYGSPLKPYTHLVVTLWYRAPELLLGAKQYSTAIDMWSLGCIMAELLSKEPLFNGKTEFDQLDKIFRTLGTPNETIWPGFSKLPGVKVNFVKHQYNLLRKKFPPTSFTGSPVLSDSGFDLLNKLLTYDPEKRITAEAALNHEWFREVPLPKSKDFMPTFPAQHAQDRRMRRVMKSPDPLEEQRKKELQGDLGGGGLFG
ncbi:cyclin-dependent kinase G-2 [Punica granatum]|uniref:Cyclin-dependent kinase G-2 n=2 Tax=Punica granatum TaxID=22663 RepID=A0A6P8CUX4_PUNGR|nr:cyclin-dependent kinase G-2 [Punica granatum]PKI78334.1 hypothetical protein CRG98_001277 [Punica granatum]